MMERLIDAAFLGAILLGYLAVALLFAAIIVELIGVERLARWLRLDR